MTLAPVTLDLSGHRLTATYRVADNEARAREVLAHLCVEQTIEFPADLVADDDIKGHLVGRVEQLRSISPHTCEADVSFAVEVSGFELPQLLNLLFGNISLLPGIQLLDVDLPSAILDVFPGPRFGAQGVRELTGAQDRALLATALKPMGLPIPVLATMAADFAANGMDLIKDDHGFASQPFARFQERVETCATAVAEANQRHGTRARYLPSLNVPADQLATAARFALDVGASGFMVLPGLHGYDAVRALAADDDLAVPIMGHPSLLGSFVTGTTSGIAPGLVFGTFMRLAGVDVSVFPNHGGRFNLTEQVCRDIAVALSGELGHLPPALPAPAGGMTLERVPEMLELYGNEVVLLIGGELHRGDRGERTRRLRDAVV